MKAKSVKIGDYEVIALLYEKNDNSVLDLIYFAAKEDVPELMFLQIGDKKEFKTFGEEKAKELLDNYSDSIDLKVEGMKKLYEADERLLFINGQESFPEGEEEVFDI